MLHVLQRYEGQIATLKKREADVTALSKTTQEEIQNAMLERDRSKEREKRTREELDRLRKRVETIEVDHLKTMTDAIETERVSLKSIVAERDREILDLKRQRAEKVAEKRRAERDRQSADEECARLKKMLEAQNERILALAKDHDAKLLDVESARQTAASALSTMRDELDALRMQLSEEKSKRSVVERERTDAQAAARVEIEKLRDKVRLAEANASASESDALRTLRVESDATLAARDREISALKKSLADGIAAKERVARERLSIEEECDRLRRSLAEQKERAASLSSSAEIARAELTAAQEYKRRLGDAERRVSNLQNELVRSRSDLEDAECAAGDMEAALHAAESRASELERALRSVQGALD